MLSIVSIGLIVSFGLIAGAFDEEHEYKFTVDIDKEAIDELQLQSNPLVGMNEKKFEKQLDKSKLDLNINYLEESLRDYSSFTDRDAKVTGNIKGLDRTYRFTGEGNVSIYEIDNMKVHYGKIYITLLGVKQGEEEGLMSFIFDENSDKIDVSITTGLVGNNAFLPFGKPFLYDHHYDMIEELKQEAKEVNAQ